MKGQTKSTVLIAMISAISAVVIAVITTYGTIAVSEPEAKKVKKELKEISDLQLIANLPIGTIVPSMLGPSTFAKAVGDLDRTTSKWVLADGQSIAATSRYSQLSNKTKTPDLRGMFLRGVNEGRKDGEQDPDDRKPGDYQQDALQQHGHKTDARKLKWGEFEENDPNATDLGYTSKGKAHAPIASVTFVTPLKDAKVTTRTAVETRPKNVAVYFYIKVN